MIRITTLFFVLLFCALVAGCRRKPPEEYERIRIQALTDAFDAVQLQDHELAVARLEKLEESEFIHQMISREQENSALAVAAEKLTAGDPAAAEQVLTKGIVKIQYTSPVRLRLAQEGLRNLLKIKEYRAKTEFDDSEDARLAVSRLPVLDRPGTMGSEGYKLWYTQQYRMVMRLEAEDNKRAAAQLVRELDYALATASGEDVLLLAELQKLQLRPRHPLVVSRTATFAALTEIEPASRDLICFLRTGVDADGVDRLYDDLEPATLCGELLKARADIRSGKKFAGLKRLRDLEVVLGKFDTKTAQLPLLEAGRTVLDGKAPTAQGLLEILYLLQD